MLVKLQPKIDKMSTIERSEFDDAETGLNKQIRNPAMVDADIWINKNRTNALGVCSFTCLF